MRLLFNFVEAFDEDSRELLEIRVQTLLLLQKPEFCCIALKDEIEKRVVLTVNFQLDLSCIDFIALSKLGSTKVNRRMEMSSAPPMWLTLRS